MNIKDLQDGMRGVNVRAEVIEVGERRKIVKPDRELVLEELTLKDPTGFISFTLWNEQVGTIPEGSMIVIHNGYVTAWREILRLNAGKYGKVQVLEKGNVTNE